MTHTVLTYKLGKCKLNSLQFDDQRLVPFREKKEICIILEGWFKDVLLYDISKKINFSKN